MQNIDDHFYVDGWVKVHLDELKRNSKPHHVIAKDRPKFPVVASHGLEDIFTKWSLANFTTQRTVVVSGAIDVKDKATIDSRLQSLYRTCIKAILTSILASPDFVKDVPKFALNNAKFSIPDDELMYAMFELNITITTQENINTWLD